MKSKSSKKNIILLVLGAISFLVVGSIFAASGIGAVAATAKSNLGALAQLITAGSYVAGMALGVAAIVKFKAHKENPTQTPISGGIALLFVSAALLFIPSVFTSTGGTLFTDGQQAGIGGFSSF